MAVSYLRIQVATATATPALRRHSTKKSECQSALLAPLSTDRLALKSAFYNAGSTLPLPGIDLALHPRMTMRVATKGGTYICKDCGYIYNDRKPFEKLPDDFFCPVCGAPKRRFKPYDLPVAKNSNQTDIRKVRKEQLKRDAVLGNALPVALAVGIAGLVGTYFFLNSQF